MSSYLQRKGSGPFHFRIRVPLDIQEWFHTPEIKRSLRTKNPSLAKSQCRSMASRAEHVFSQIRSGFLSEQQIQQLVENHFPSRRGIPAKADKPRTLSEVMHAHIQEHVLLGKWTDKTRLEVESCLKVFTDLVGDRPVCSLDRNLMVDFLEKLCRLPANMNKKADYRDKTVHQILEMQGVEPMSASTVNKYLSRVGALMIYCVRQGHMDRNPAEGLALARTVKDEEERSAYERCDLKKLIPSLGEYREVAPERYFVPLIGCYSGARLNEICQFYVEDVKEVEGIWCFDINDEKDKRLKTLSSRRIIPVHPKLVDLGFLDYVEKLRKRGLPRVWMSLVPGRDGYSHLLGKWYQRHNRSFVTDDPKKCFHSFRHLVADTLKQSCVDEGIIAEILGHTNKSITTGRYGKRYRPQILLDALMKLDY